MSDIKNLIIILILAVVIGAVLIFVPKKDEPNQAEKYAHITNFFDCAEAGFPVAESFPSQCRTPDGRMFVEDITEQREVIIETPEIGQVVTSPLTVKGSAKGTWFFEANIPLTLKDSNGKLLVQVGATATSDWMTTEHVGFSAVMEFAKPETEYGVLLIEKDNPSGLPENDASYAVPVKFK